MLNKLWECISDENYKISTLRTILEDVGQIVNYFEGDMIKEGCKNSAIDAICEFLQAHKDKEENK